MYSLFEWMIQTAFNQSKLNYIWDKYRHLFTPEQINQLKIYSTQGPYRLDLPTIPGIHQTF